jgi:hypothetical protein
MGTENWDKPGAGTPETDRKKDELTPGEQLRRKIEDPDRFKPKTGEEIRRQHEEEGFYPTKK